MQACERTSRKTVKERNGRGSEEINGRRKSKESSKNERKKSRGTPLRGRGTPAYPARLRSERARNSKRQASQMVERSKCSKRLADIPGGQPRKVALASWSCQKNVPEKSSCQKRLPGKNPAIFLPQKSGGASVFL